MHTYAKWALIVVLAASLAAFPQTSTRITLNVVAFDSHDQIVDDLTSQDFQVSDQGKPQQIVSFGRIGTDAQPVVVILLDLMNTNLANRGYAQDEIIRALKPLRSSESVYLYLLTYSGSLYPVHALPEEGGGADLATAGWTQNIQPRLEAAIDRVFGLKTSDDKLPSVRVEESYAAIKTLASTMQSLPGWKNLIWVTHGVPILVTQSVQRNHDYSPQLRRIATTLDHMNITLSSVDPGGELGSASLDTLNQFANLTGGKVYNNDFAKALSDITTAWRSGYVIQYAAPPADGKYHKIHVTCSRKGVHLQVKQGYYAN
jgi:VWFA-related protein